MTKEDLKEKYDAIWNRFQNAEFNKSESRLLDRGFTFQYDGRANIDILFIGINPAFLEEGNGDRSSYTKQQALGYKRYFKPFEEIGGENWSHMDLMVFKETNQKFIEDVLFKSDDGLKFIMTQLEVAKAYLDFLNPKIIVVSNVLAGRLLGKYMSEDKKHNIWAGYEFEFDKEIGTHKIVSSGKLNGTPVFFTSMLSGQRALDLGSKERLIWHINCVKKSIKQ